MSEFTFYKGWLLTELGEPAGGMPPPPGGAGGGMPPLGGAGGPPPMGGGGGMPPPPMGGGGGMGDPMGGDPMGGGAPGKPIPIKTITAADVWGMLEKIVNDEKYEKFFDQIGVNKKRPEAQVFKKKEKETSLQK